MSKEKTERAIRRQHLERMKAKAMKIYPAMGEAAKKLANHLRHCSCLACRKGEKVKYKEKPDKKTLENK